MKYFTFNINKNAKLEFNNDYTGKESIFYNGEEVSSIRSFCGGHHSFKVNEAGEQVNYDVKISMNMFTGIASEIMRNGEVLFSNKPEMKTSAGSWIGIILLVFLFIVATVVGYKFGQGNSYYLALIFFLSGIGLILNQYRNKKKD
ncbi:hypothetical protein [Jiulongibacter sp. NS-SX5]|uniref:hypothetical protein n=1 Tax=Jiulongibacter sp. NS-SX5 TaxID=3463854 RepID=UPI004059C2EC